MSYLFIVLTSDSRELSGAILSDVFQVLNLRIVIISDTFHLRGAVVTNPVSLLIGKNKKRSHDSRDCTNVSSDLR